jgi:hypothetical protein
MLICHVAFAGGTSLFWMGRTVMRTDLTTSPVPLLARLFWAMVGPLILILLCVANARSASAWLTSADVAYVIILGGVIFARWLEFRGGDPRTATGEPATMAHFHRYALMAMGIGLGLWIVTKLIGNHWET